MRPQCGPSARRRRGRACTPRAYDALHPLPDELIAALPHLLGFRPEESVVFVPLSSDLPVARVDLPTTAGDRELVWRGIREGFSRYAQPGASAAVVCLTADRSSADLVSRELAGRLSSIGIDARVRLWADDAGWCNPDGGDSGLQTSEARERIAAMTVLQGRALPATSRDSLATSFVGDREPLADRLPRAREAASMSTPQAEGRWALARLEEFHADGLRLHDGDAARLLVAIDAIPIRDRLWTT